MSSPEFVDLARAALEARAALAAAVRDQPQPPVDSSAYLAWHDDKLAPARDASHRASAMFVDHALYPPAHRRAWGDDFTIGTIAGYAWIPVARRVVEEAPDAR